MTTADPDAGRRSSCSPALPMRIGMILAVFQRQFGWSIS
jgi:hypothetical protein